MNTKTAACLSLLLAFVLPSAYGNNPKKPAPVTKQVRAPATAQRGRPGQTPMRTQSRTTAARGNVRTQSRTAASRGTGRTAADRVYNFHGPHRGGGRYVDGRLVGRYANDRVFVNDHWYAWQAPPLGIFGVGTYGWVAEDGGGAVAVDSGPAFALVEPAPVIVSTGPDYFVVRNGIFTRQISRAEFVRSYPHYARANHITATGGRGGTAARTAAMRGGTATRTAAMRGGTMGARGGTAATRMQPARVSRAPAPKTTAYKKH